MKLKYVLYMAAALSLTGCNDSFLERGPQNLNDQSFWVSVNDLKAYANAQGIEIIGDLPIYVAEDSVFWMTRTVTFRSPTISILSYGDNMLYLQKVAYGKNQTGRTFETSIIS